MVTDISEITGGEGRSNGGGLYRVTADEIDLNGTVLRQRTYTCRYLFMGAGSVGTSALLTKARTKGTLPRLNNLVGTDWGGNGDFIAVRGGLGSFLPARGGPCGHFLFEDMANPSAPTNMVELVVPKDFEQIALGGAPGFSLYVGLSAAAPPLGTFSYNPATNATTLNWPNLDSRLNTFSAGVNAMLNRVNAANPGSFNIFNSEDPTYKAMGGPALTAHPVGGVVMGKACDTYGRVLGYSGLYVVDGALVPGGSVGGVNPAWTIAALSERAMDNIISRDFGNRRTRSSLDRVLTA
jgi:cholesterol oxidase